MHSVRAVLVLLISLLCSSTVAGYCYSPTPTGNLTNTNGTILSDTDGVGPELYANDNECEWIIHCPAGSQLFITSIEGYIESNYDFLSIFDPKTDAFIADDVSGVLKSKIPAELIDTDTLIITFTSDGSLTTYGFTLEYQCYENGLPFDCAAQSPAPAYDYYRPDSSCRVNVDVSACRNNFSRCVLNVSDCGTTMACFHQLYACLETLPQQPEDSACFSFYEQILAAKMLLANGAPYEGSALEAACLKTTCEDVTLLGSDCPVYPLKACVMPDVGGLITPAPTPVPPAPTPAPNPIFPCIGTTPQGIFTDLRGTIVSDEDGSGFNHTYVNDNLCEWTVSCPGSKLLFLDVEGKLESGFDFLEIVDPSNGGSIIAVTGDVRDGFLLGLTSFNSLTFRFTSDENVIDFGFTLSYQCFSTASNGSDSCTALSSVVPKPENPYLPPKACSSANGDVGICMRNYTDCQSGASQCVEVMGCIRERNLCLEKVISQGGIAAENEDASPCHQWSVDFETSIVLANTGGYSGSILKNWCTVAACNASADSHLAFMSAAVCPVDVDEVCSLPPVPTAPPARDPTICHALTPQGVLPSTQGQILAFVSGGRKYPPRRCLWSIRCDRGHTIEIEARGYINKLYDLLTVTDATSGEIVADVSGPKVADTPLNMGFSPYRSLDILFATNESSTGYFSLNYRCRGQNEDNCGALPTNIPDFYSAPAICVNWNPYSGLPDSLDRCARKLSFCASTSGGVFTCETLDVCTRQAIECYNKIQEPDPTGWSEGCKTWLADFVAAKNAIRDGAPYEGSVVRDSCRKYACFMASSFWGKPRSFMQMGCRVVTDDMCLKSNVIANQPTVAGGLKTTTPATTSAALTNLPATQLPTDPSIAVFPPTFTSATRSTTSPPPASTPVPESGRDDNGQPAAPEEGSNGSTTTVVVSVVVAAVAVGIMTGIVVYLVRRRRKRNEKRKRWSFRYPGDDGGTSPQVSRYGACDGPGAGDEQFAGGIDEFERRSDDSGENNGFAGQEERGDAASAEATVFEAEDRIPDDFSDGVSTFRVPAVGEQSQEPEPELSPDFEEVADGENSHLPEDPPLPRQKKEDLTVEVEKPVDGNRETHLRREAEDGMHSNTTVGSDGDGIQVQINTETV